MHGTMCVKKKYLRILLQHILAIDKNHLQEGLLTQRKYTVLKRTVINRFT